jgi:hypothetical protein
MGGSAAHGSSLGPNDLREVGVVFRKSKKKNQLNQNKNLALVRE